MRKRNYWYADSAGFYSDLHVYDSHSMTWFNLSGHIIGTPPTARWAHGFTSSGGKLYVHGGNDDLSFISSVASPP